MGKKERERDGGGGSKRQWEREIMTLELTRINELKVVVKRYGDEVGELLFLHTALWITTHLSLEFIVAFSAKCVLPTPIGHIVEVLS